MKNIVLLYLLYIFNIFERYCVRWGGCAGSRLDPGLEIPFGAAALAVIITLNTTGSRNGLEGLDKVYHTDKIEENQLVLSEPPRESSTFNSKSKDLGFSLFRCLEKHDISAGGCIRPCRSNPDWNLQCFVADPFTLTLKVRRNVGLSTMRGQSVFCLTKA